VNLLTSAPFSNSNSIISLFPLAAAVISGADVNFDSFISGTKPLFYAISLFDPNIHVLNPDGSVNSKTAGEEEIITIAELLVNKGANLEIINWHGGTLLHYAVFNNQIKLTEWLISKGSDINAQEGSEMGFTPLMTAAANGNKDIILLLLEKGAEVNKFTYSGTTLDWAYAFMRKENEEKGKEIINLLKSRGAKGS